MIPSTMPILAWQALQRAKALGFTASARQYAAQWVVTIDGEVGHADDAQKMLAAARRRREQQPQAAA